MKTLKYKINEILIEWEDDIFDKLEVNSAKVLLGEVEKLSGQKMITKSILSKNFEYVLGAVANLQGSDKEVIEKVFIRSKW